MVTTLVAVLLVTACGNTVRPRPRDPRAPLPSVRIVAPDGAADSYFGGARWFNTFVSPVAADYYATPGQAAMSADGRTVVVGVPGEANAAGEGAGAVHVFVRRGSGWVAEARIEPEKPAQYAGFGWKVSLTPDARTLLVGEPFRDGATSEDEGAAYVFERRGSEWRQSATLRAGLPGTYAEFGWSVALSADARTAIVGAPGRSVGEAQSAGVVHVLRRGDRTWTERTMIAAPVPEPLGDYGSAVDLAKDENILVVSQAATRSADGQDHKGALFVYQGDADWQTVEPLTSFDDDEPNTEGQVNAYGVDAVVSDDGRVIAVAAPDQNIGRALGAGAAFVYATRCDWTHPQCVRRLRVASPRPAASAYYASATALSGDGTRLVLGNDGAGTNGQGEGEAVDLAPFARDGIRIRGRVTFPAPNRRIGRFGTAVAASADARTMIGTAPFLRVGANRRQGAGYVVALPTRDTR